ncbi:Concanavalin A-like lectin/glucanase, subgroup [Penicillium expansum]|uniref:Crh-like protein n=1 Tax=Penicillium expansum TaxID=27334 RepID=A0A0A2J1N4_PENEN|nr:Concanavalin A-like lectin/glucanase, subgroup [Penicillium expansum]KGO49219.1 Concanavalin A-like lectin/glucanase, subgroup [Penicillium expansum]KGO54150.1 Concanavalin A-like lectin/glucanase, subgroup [Penicillium expansum]KGO61579.1 Concanavalin A-like lectin/glucanase, subgroup [Penicillium expansum]
MLYYLKYAAAGLAAATLVSGQTYTDCNPMKKTCPANPGTTESSHFFDFTQSSGLDKWTTTAGTIKTGSNGAEFTVGKKGDAPTIQSDFYIFFGEVSVTLKAAPGTGIVSSIVLESDDLDEIDWETVGGDTTQVESNYFGKGDTTTYDRAIWHPVSSPQEDFHTYKVVWTKEATTWSVDGKVLRTLAYNDAKSGTRYPQTPMNVRIGIWAGGDPSNAPGTIEWAGGKTDYTKAPFTMYIKDVTIVNYNPSESYTWSDQTGSYESIKFTGSTNSTSESSSTSKSSKTSEATSTASMTSKTTAATTSGSLISASNTATPSSSASASGSSSNSGSSSSSGSSSGSSSSSSASPSASPAFNAASNLSAGSFGFLSILGAISGLLFL